MRKFFLFFIIVFFSVDLFYASEKDKNIISTTNNTKEKNIINTKENNIINNEIINNENIIINNEKKESLENLKQIITAAKKNQKNSKELLEELSKAINNSQPTYSRKRPGKAEVSESEYMTNGDFRPLLFKNVPFLGEYDEVLNFYLLFTCELDYFYFSFFPKEMWKDVLDYLKKNDILPQDFKIFLNYQYLKRHQFVNKDDKGNLNENILLKPHFFLLEKDLSEGGRYNLLLKNFKEAEEKCGDNIEEKINNLNGIISEYKNVKKIDNFEDYKKHYEEEYQKSQQNASNEEQKAKLGEQVKDYQKILDNPDQQYEAAQKKYQQIRKQKAGLEKLLKQKNDLLHKLIRLYWYCKSYCLIYKNLEESDAKEIEESSSCCNSCCEYLGLRRRLKKGCVFNGYVNTLSLHGGTISWQEPSIGVKVGGLTPDKCYCYYSFVLCPKTKKAAMTIHFFFVSDNPFLQEYHRNGLCKSIEQALNIAGKQKHADVVKFLEYISPNK